MASACLVRRPDLHRVELRDAFRLDLDSRRLRRRGRQQRRAALRSEGQRHSARKRGRIPWLMDTMRHAARCVLSAYRVKLGGGRGACLELETTVVPSRPQARYTDSNGRSLGTPDADTTGRTTDGHPGARAPTRQVTLCDTPGPGPGVSQYTVRSVHRSTAGQHAAQMHRSRESPGHLLSQANCDQIIRVRDEVARRASEPTNHVREENVPRERPTSEIHEAQTFVISSQPPPEGNRQRASSSGLAWRADCPLPRLGAAAGLPHLITFRELHTWRHAARCGSTPAYQLPAWPAGS